MTESFWVGRIPYYTGIYYFEPGGDCFDIGALAI